MSRFLKGMIIGSLLGAAAGAFLMLRADEETERALIEGGRRIGQTARRTATVIRGGGARLGRMLSTGRRFLRTPVM